MPKYSTEHPALADLATMLTRLLESARNLPAGPDRYSVIKQIGIFGARLAELQKTCCQSDPSTGKAG
jgi:hypothetical protein